MSAARLTQGSAQGQQSGSVGAEVTAFALTLGRLGFQVSTLGGGDMSLAPDIVEVTRVVRSPAIPSG